MSDFRVESQESNENRWPPIFYPLALPIYLVYKAFVLSVRLQAYMVRQQCWLLGIDSTVELRESKYWKWMKDVQLPVPKLDVEWWNRDDS